ncbi:MAG TPA: winged helix DNA-binding domain-containing protein [Candidatus Limnocylindrales bacterium]|nr:winged helix DNA-binding domain-containing protein [Candidatus Limnocylindrales bacterium]
MTPSAGRVPELTWPDVLRRRLDAHRLAIPADGHAVAAVVGDVCGMHGQLLASVELSVGLRVVDTTRADVRAALWGSRALVRTYGLRGTIHVYPADELALWRSALDALPFPNRGRMLDAIGVTQKVANEVVDAIGEAVGAVPLPLTELEQAVALRVGAWVGERRGEAFGSGQSRVRSLLPDACRAGLVCFGPNDGVRVTYVRPSDWVGPQRPVSSDRALATFVRRYLASYGPATVRDFREWTMTSTGAARRAFDLIRDELVEVRVDGRRSWWLPAALDAVGLSRPRADGPSAQLLPHFDPYLVGSRPRDVLVPRAVQSAVAHRGLARHDLHATLPVVVVDGAVAGLWKRTPRRETVEITVEPLMDLSPAARGAIEAAGDRVGSILGLRPELAFGRVEARPHL